MKKKIILYITAMVLLFTVVAGATFAYLSANSGNLVNTFNPSYIGKPVVTESELDLHIVPSVNITKNPTVQYKHDTNGTDVKCVLLYAVLDLEPTSTAWVRTAGADATKGDSYKFTSSGDTLTFTTEPDHWTYVGTTAGTKYVYVYKTVLDGTKDSTAFNVIDENVVKPSSGWTEQELINTFGAGGVQIIVGAFTAQAQPTYDATGATVAAADAKTIWNNCHSADADKIS